MDEKDKKFIKIVVAIIFALILLYSCGVDVMTHNFMIRIMNEVRVDKNKAEEMVKNDIAIIFGNEYAKTLNFKYGGLRQENNSSSGPIPDLSISLRPNYDFWTDYLGYFYLVDTSIFELPICINYKWDDLEKMNETDNMLTYGTVVVPKGNYTSKEFERFYLAKMGFDVDNIKSAEICIDTDDLNFDKFNLEKYDKESIFSILKVNNISNITYDESNLSIESVKNKLSKLSIPISNIYNNIENNYTGYSIQFAEKGRFNVQNSVIAYSEYIDEDYVYFKICGNGIEEYYYKVKYDGVNNNNYINKINYKRVVKDFLNSDNDAINMLPISDLIKNDRAKYLMELVGGKLEIISYKSSYCKKRICFLLNKSNSVELLEYVFSLNSNNNINYLKLDNRVMLKKNGNNMYDEFCNVKNDLWKNIFVLCNPRYMSENIILSITDNFYKKNIKFFENSMSILDTDTFVDKNKYKVYLLKGDNFYEFDYKVKITDEGLIDDVKFIYSRAYKNISKNNYEIVDNLISQYKIDKISPKLSNDFLYTIRNDLNCITLGNGMLNLNHSIYYYNKEVQQEDEILKAINIEDEMRKDIEASLHHSSSFYEIGLLFNKYGVINVLKYSRLGDRFKLNIGKGTDLNFIVVRKDDDKVLLLADFVWPLRDKDESGMTINYEYSNVRSSLNYLAENLIEEIVNNLIETKLDNHSNNKFGINLGNDTNDKIFILSVDEMRQIKKECDFINDWTMRGFAPYILRTAGRDKTTFVFTKLIKLDNGHYDAEYSYEPNDYGSVLPSEKLTLATRPAMWVRID